MFDKLAQKITQTFSKMVVFAFVGESGTGKSYHAKILAEENKIEAIIDDGLLIQDEKIIAGRSAKRENTYMGAVRVALFDDKDHRDSVAKVLRKSKIKRIMIIGTSEKMVTKIAIRLQLPQPQKIIHIEDVATPEEIEKAKKSRHVEGKHVIPVPSIEVKKKYPQIFSDSMRDFFNFHNIFKFKSKGRLMEKSIVEPEFSKKGRFEISEAALTQMTMHCVTECDPDIKVKKITIKKDSRGYKLIVTIDVPFGTQLTGKVHKLQQYIIDKIEMCTNILIEEVNIVIDKISMDKKDFTEPVTEPETSKKPKEKKKKKEKLKK